MTPCRPGVHSLRLPGRRGELSFYRDA